MDVVGLPPRLLPMTVRFPDSSRVTVERSRLGWKPVIVSSCTLTPDIHLHGMLAVGRSRKLSGPQLLYSMPWPPTAGSLSVGEDRADEEEKNLVAEIPWSDNFVAPGGAATTAIPPLLRPKSSRYDAR